MYIRGFIANTYTSYNIIVRFLTELYIESSEAGLLILRQSSAAVWRQQSKTWSRKRGSEMIPCYTLTVMERTAGETGDSGQWQRRETGWRAGRWGAGRSETGHPFTMPGRVGGWVTARRHPGHHQPSRGEPPPSSLTPASSTPRELYTSMGVTRPANLPGNPIRLDQAKKIECPTAIE